MHKEAHKTLVKAVIELEDIIMNVSRGHPQDMKAYRRAVARTALRCVEDAIFYLEEGWGDPDRP